MTRIIHLLMFTIIISCTPKPKSTAQLLSNTDSTEIANSSLTFYNWYLNCLKTDSTYNIVQPNYHWEDTIPVLNISEYLKRLGALGVVSDVFYNSEVERFKVCQDSLYTINHTEVDSCGCSVGEFYSVCEFIDYYYWINTQEKFDGCEVKEIEIKNETATCQLIFFYDSDNLNGKYYEENFICLLNLKKYADNWLIDKIDKHIK